MSQREFGNPPILSTGALVANPSTSDVLAKLTGLKNGNYEARFFCGASTNANFFLERATSSGAAAALESVPVFTPAYQTGQYVVTFRPESGNALRVRVTGVGGGALGANTASATIQTEIVT